MSITELYKKITNLETLTPGNEVNAAFSELVNKAIDHEADGTLSQEEIEHLQELSSKAEYELEKYWANLIIESSTPKETFKDFPYLKNYKDLTKLELYSLHSCTDHTKHAVIFIGGGPLPMTAIMLALEHKISSVVIDCDENAVELSKKLIKVLGLTGMIQVFLADGETFDYKNYNMIYIAALAGTDENVKLRIFKRIKETSKKGSHIIARSTWGNRELLYKPLPKSLYKIFKPIIKVDPYNEIVNSVVILEND